MSAVADVGARSPAAVGEGMTPKALWTLAITSVAVFMVTLVIAQFFQTVQGLSPFQSGLRVLPWTAMPMLIAPIAGAASDRIGGQRLMGAGLTLQAIGLAWIAAVTTPTTRYVELIGPFLISGVGMALFFAPVANVVLSSVWAHEEGQASGANNAIRELGGVFGVAVLAAVFTGNGGYRSGQAFVDGMDPAVTIGAALVAIGASGAFAIKHVPQPTHAAVPPDVPLVARCGCASCCCAPALCEECTCTSCQCAQADEGMGTRDQDLPLGSHDASPQPAPIPIQT